ncbi:MAG: hypothetical protein HC847_28950 [Hydrococcus sp. RU_2_2]|nr:hypothetical protein [Hydrococcus sp. RU_2_2]
MTSIPFTSSGDNPPQYLFPRQSSAVVPAGGMPSDNNGSRINLGCSATTRFGSTGTQVFPSECRTTWHSEEIPDGSVKGSEPGMNKWQDVMRSKEKAMTRTGLRDRFTIVVGK